MHVTIRTSGASRARRAEALATARGVRRRETPCQSWACAPAVAVGSSDAILGEAKSLSVDPTTDERVAKATGAFSSGGVLAHC
jgi:hypothetical protein